MKWRLITIIALVIAAPAQADMTAVYSTKGIRGTIIVPVRMTVEIADNGYARYQTSDENKYGVVRDGVAYIVEARPTGPVVDRVAPAARATDEVAGGVIGAVIETCVGIALRTDSQRHHKKYQNDQRERHSLHRSLLLL